MGHLAFSSRAALCVLVTDCALWIFLRRCYQINWMVNCSCTWSLISDLAALLSVQVAQRPNSPTAAFCCQFFYRRVLIMYQNIFSNDPLLFGVSYSSANASLGPCLGKL